MRAAIRIAGLLVVLVVLGVGVLTAVKNLRSESPDVGALVRREVVLLPAEESGGYVAPSPSELSQAPGLARALLAGDVGGARRVTDALGYEILSGTDIDGRKFLAAREDPGSPTRRGWGTLVVVEQGDPVVIEVAHPLADKDTEEIGLNLFRRTKARALLVAGTHRDANPDGDADVAHNPLSMFHALHRELVKPGVLVLQPHGFSARGHPDLEADVVVSSAQRAPSSLAVAVGDDLGTANITTCVYDRPGCRELGGTSNEQATQTIAAGGDFIHLEISTTFRQEPGWIDTLTAPIASAIQRSRLEQS